MKIFEFSSQLTVPRPIDEVFEFFSNPANLTILSPPWLKFEMQSEHEAKMLAGIEFDYKLKVRGIPLKWRSRITEWDPPNRFADEQIKGPYNLWVHTHSFEEQDRNTVVRDHIQYSVPGGSIINSLFVRRDVEKIFKYRGDKLTEIFGEDT